MQVKNSEALGFCSTWKNGQLLLLGYKVSIDTEVLLLKYCY